jgi:hypothetical protein
MQIEKDAIAVLGEPVIEGVILLARGATKKIRASGGALANVLTKDTTPVAPAPGGYDGGAFLTLTASRLVLFGSVSGFFKQKLGEQLAQFNPGEVDRFEFGTAAAGVGTLDIVGTNGDRWAFEFSKVSQKKLVRIAEASRALVVD